MTPKKQENAEEHYGRLVKEERVKDDAAQRNVLIALQLLADRLKPKKSRLFRGIKVDDARGIYIWGNVGRGKSMLMDLFFEHAPLKKKRRVHFHAFMQEVHARIHALRQEKRTDPVAWLSRQLAGENTLLCFDELQATDVTDATLLYRLFSGLFAAGVTIVSTSNHPPASLYTGGVQAERFAKFIALIKEHMQVMPLSSPADYRQAQKKSADQRYFFPLGKAAEAFVEQSLKRLGAGSPRREALSVQGHKTAFMMYADGIGRFTFHDLCETALGAADYLALAKRLHTVILTDIPKLSPEKRNEAKRFVTLIDALYEHKMRLICTAASAPDKLYEHGDGSMEFKRTASRLIEMQSEKWHGAA